MTGGAFPEGVAIINGQLPCRKKPKALQNAHLRRCASSFVIATYEKIRLIPQDSRALHLNIFEQSSK
ncbi:MAG: hypothetical protein CVU55_12240 [Deltaproteobacteria bacterium HGW-Deltaproteobacteria-13]|nr:MAG: hypothetical protein CVU55_12240 [Deltaproteobacteria bacterium HGW-Deltaproteobacteria-13]